MLLNLLPWHSAPLKLPKDPPPLEDFLSSIVASVCEERSELNKVLSIVNVLGVTDEQTEFRSRIIAFFHVGPRADSFHVDDKFKSPFLGELNFHFVFATCSPSQKTREMLEQ